MEYKCADDSYCIITDMNDLKDIQILSVWSAIIK
jgi:hypothetical protein